MARGRNRRIKTPLLRADALDDDLQVEESMAGTGYHPEGHKLRPYFGILRSDNVAHMICVNCAEVDPEPGSECIDDC